MRWTAAASIVRKTPGVGVGRSLLQLLLGAETVAGLSARSIRGIAEALAATPAAAGRGCYATFSPARSEEAPRPLPPPGGRSVFRRAAMIGELLGRGQAQDASACSRDQRGSRRFSRRSSASRPRL